MYQLKSESLFAQKERSENMKKKLFILIVSILLIFGITFLWGVVSSVTNIYLRYILLVIFNVLNASIALISMKLTNIKLDFDFKNKKQYIIGIVIACIISLSTILIPTLFGGSIIGQHIEFSWFTLVSKFISFIFVVGPVEELIFRVYIQETCISFFKKNKYIAVIISAFLFGIVHLINGSIVQVIFAFGFGLIFGFCKYLIKDCKYLGLSLGHGLYDFLNVIIGMFII